MKHLILTFLASALLAALIVTGAVAARLEDRKEECSPAKGVKSASAVAYCLVLERE